MRLYGAEKMDGFPITRRQVYLAVGRQNAITSLSKSSSRGERPVNVNEA